MPGPGGRFRKVWVGPKRVQIFAFQQMLTRGSYAELAVNVRLGAHFTCFTSTQVQILTRAGRMLSSPSLSASAPLLAKPVCYAAAASWTATARAEPFSWLVAGA
jgi:hypothetical protein